MFYYFGIILVLAAAAQGQRIRVPNRLRTKFPKSAAVIPATASVSEDPENDRTIVGYKPIFGYLDNLSKEDNSYRLPSDWDYECPKRYSYYKYEGRGSCDIYVECRNFKPSLKVCPDGMHFKEKSRWAEYPCAYPPEAECLTRDELPARPTGVCPHQFGNFPIADSTEYSQYDRCSRYIACASGVAHLMNCSFGLVFNPQIRLCDWPEKVPGCNDVLNYRCPVSRIGEEDMVVNYRPHRWTMGKNNPGHPVILRWTTGKNIMWGDHEQGAIFRYPDPECRYFLSCQNGKYRLLSCDEGLLFDHRIGRCVEYDDFICDYKEVKGQLPIYEYTSEEDDLSL